MLKALRAKLAENSNAGFRRYAVNISWMMGERALRMSVGLFVGIWVARYLGPEQFGLLSYAQSFVFLFTAISTLGLDGVMVRELVKDERNSNELLGTAFVLKLMGALLVLPVLWLAIQFTNNDKYTNILVFIISAAAIFQSFNVIDFYYQANVQSKYVALANTLSLSLSSVVKIALILIEAPLTAFAFVVVLDALILSIGLVCFYRYSSCKRLFNWSFNAATAGKMLRDSWPLIFSGLVVSIYMKIDQVMIKEMLGADAVGQYAAAVRLSEVWYFVPMVIANSVFPAILNAKKVGENLYLRRLQRLYTVMVWIAIFVAFPVSVFSDELIGLLYGVAYEEASEILRLHVWASVFVFMGVASSKWLLSENLQLYSMLNTSVGAICNIGLNVLLIESHGVVGAAIATLISYCIAAYLMHFCWRRTRQNFYLLSGSIIGRA